MSDPLAHIRTLAAADPAKWGPALAEHERQLAGQPRADLPPLWKQAANFVASAVEHVAAGMPEASPAAAAARLEICRACSRYLADSGRCAACGCYLAAKTTWELQTCPEGKW